MACGQTLVTKRVSQAIDYTDFAAIHSLYMQGAKNVAREFCDKKLKQIHSYTILNCPKIGCKNIVKPFPMFQEQSCESCRRS